MTHLGATYDTFAVDIQSSRLTFFFRDDASRRFQTFGNLRQHLRGLGRELIFATNAGMFSDSYEPVGLYIEGGRQLYPLNLNGGTGNFYMKPNGVFFLTSGGAGVIESSRFPAVAASTRILYATQSGPLLVTDGTIHSAFREISPNRHVRNGVGILSPGRVIFAISNEPVTLYQFASLFRDKLRCRDALYLDGAISRMFLPAIKRTDLEGDFGAMIALSRASD